jgi:hypothetical protein
MLRLQTTSARGKCWTKMKENQGKVNLNWVIW